jgi:F-box interacting protein
MAPLHPGLPDEIAIWEILIRLDPKALLRCRAVCRGWLRATSTREFLVIHHGRQPTLPLLDGYNGDVDDRTLDIIPLDHRARLVAADQLQPIARLDHRHPLQSCDGLLLLCTNGTDISNGGADIKRQYSICNPATRQYAPLRQIADFIVVAMYPHGHTGEYRLLLYPGRLMNGNLAPGLHDGFYVFTLGSCQPPRHIGWPEAKEVMLERNVLFRGNLHWYMEVLESSKAGMILVFDTMEESFTEMRAAPIDRGDADLFEMDGMLILAKFNNAAEAIDIWVLQDYEREIWTCKCQIRLPAEDIRAQFQEVHRNWDVQVTSSDEAVIILVLYGLYRILQIDIDGKLVATFHREGLCRGLLRLKQSLVPHTFFPALEGYVVNSLPFM